MIKAQRSLSGKSAGKIVRASPLHSTEGTYTSLHGNCTQESHAAVGPTPLRDTYSTSDTKAAASSACQNDGTSLHASAAPAEVYNAGQPNPTPLHPAIRPQYGATWQQNFSTPSSVDPRQLLPDVWGRRHQTTSPGMTMTAQGPTPARTPSFTKQSHSPIPLPPYAQKLNGTPTTNGSISFPAATSPRVPLAFDSRPADKARQQERGQPLNLQAPSPTPSPQQQQAYAPYGGYYGNMIPTPVSAAPQPPPYPVHQQQFYQAGPPAVPQWNTYENSHVHGPPTGSGELPDVPADSTALLEQIMANLRRASERDARVS